MANENVCTVVKNLKVTARSEDLQTARDFVNQAALEYGLDAPERSLLVLAVDEAISNAISDGYGQENKGDVEIEVESDDHGFQMTFRDSGRPFQPFDPKILSSLKEERVEEDPRGLGIFLTHRIMDSVWMSVAPDGRNELKMMKLTQLRKAS